MKKNLFTLVLFASFSLTSNAQQDALFTQYMDAQLYSNAAAAGNGIGSGSEDLLTFTALHRQQWAGFKGAPTTTGVMIDSPLPYESVAIGGEVWNDRIGSYNRTSVCLNFAYKFKIGTDGKLSLGVKGVADFNSHDFSDVSNASTDAAALRYTNTVTPNVGVGALYRSSKWFLGFGIPRVIANTDSTRNGGYTNRAHTYVVGGYIFDLNQDWNLRTSLRVRAIKAGPLNTDLSLAFVNNDKLWMGLNYRYSESAGVFFQYQVAPAFKIGYAFDFNVNSLRTINYGSHEILLKLSLRRKGDGVERTPSVI